ncbi:MAG: hypothetical protein P0Y53_18435 [Candidatus Pseudobacter hemicellulosilyticus]|uniref:Uncharacterized protein n=1 Tax=Candidatus Pseudobacter hemicellulosilyticus TaxID=3121375 RepID=A0AAJ5WQY8_9BACT|nr:MAG: hypothetical protein P0Y53_18435 [Pseudobacter sp.]
MRIGLFETDHFEVTHTLLRLFDNGTHELTLFVYDYSWRQLQYLLEEQPARNLSVIVRAPEESRRQFIARMQQETGQRQLDLLLLNTVADNYLHYAAMVSKLRPRRILLTLHDIHQFLDTPPGLSLRSWASYLGKRWLLKNIQELNVLAAPMQTYLQQRLPAKTIHLLPGAFFEGTSYREPAMPVEQLLRLVVPGSVDPRRRDYEQVFTLLEAARVKGFAIEITLLGAFTGEEGANLLQRCQDYAAKYDNLKFFGKETVHQSRFDQLMQEAHLVFTPSVIHTRMEGKVEEVYGLSITSGNLADCIRYARPWLIPAALQTPEDREPAIIRYTAPDDLPGLLKSLQEEPARYAALLQRALTVSRTYTLENIRQQNPDLFGG